MSFDRYLAVAKGFQSSPLVTTLRKTKTAHVIGIVGWGISVAASSALWANTSASHCICGQTFDTDENSGNPGSIKKRVSE